MRNGGAHEVFRGGGMKRFFQKRARSRTAAGRGTAISLAGAFAMTFPSAVSAQSATTLELPEKLVDRNHVDIAGANLSVSFPLIQFGDEVRLHAQLLGEHGLGSILPNYSNVPPIDI